MRWESESGEERCREFTEAASRSINTGREGKAVGV